MGSRGRLGAGSKASRILCFLAILFVPDFQGEIFISNKERTNRNKESMVCFCLLCFSLRVFFFFLVPNSEMECLAPRGEAEGEVFLTFPVIPLVFYFFGV